MFFEGEEEEYEAGAEAFHWLPSLTLEEQRQLNLLAVAAYAALGLWVLLAHVVRMIVA